MIIVEVPAVVPPSPDDGEQPRPYIEPRLGLGVLLTGGDGSTWDLYGGGPVRLQSGARLGVADPEHWRRTAPAIDGSFYQGMRTPASRPFYPVRITTDTSQEWIDTYRAFMSAIDGSRECQVTVVAPSGSARTLTVRYEEGMDNETDVDPVRMRHAVYPLAWQADDPYWHTTPIAKRYEVREALPLFAPPSQNPPAVFNFGSGEAISEGLVTNPGDVLAWPKWTITGPFSSATVGVGDATLVFGTPIAAGQKRVVDTSPFRRNRLPEEQWLEITDANFAAIPPGEDVALTMNLSGPAVGATIELEFTPSYRRFL